MSREMSRAILSLLLVGATAISGSAQQPARDATTTPTVGTASISGVVVGVGVNDDASPQPVRRAIVTLAGPDLKPSRGAITDDGGRFTIANLPAGRFTLTVTRASFVTSVYGAKRPGRPGTPIVVASGAKMTGLSVRIWRGAAIAGVIRDESGAPVPNLPVSATPARDIPPGGIFTLSNNGATTNDQGEYRIFGLEPGAYVVSVRPSSSSTPLTSMTEAQVDAAFDAIRRRTTGGATPAPAAPVPEESPRPFAYTPVYFPGTPVLEDATPLTLKAGDERAGVDISLLRVATSFITGIVTRPDGSPAAGANLELTRIPRPGPFNVGQPARLTATAGADGRFRVAQVQPGEYRLIGRASAGPPPVDTPGIVRPPTADGSLWATTDISVSGSDINGVALTVTPGLAISGRIVFRSSLTPATPTPTLTRARVALLAPWVLGLKPNTPIDSSNAFSTANVQPDGSFRFAGLLPDTYAMQVTPGAVNAPWSLRSAMIGDRDLLDSPTDFSTVAPGSTLVITYSDTRSELSGSLQTSTGAAFSDVFVLAYSTDRKFWVSRSRRVQAVRPGVDGRFTFSDLPPGEYLLGAVMDVDQDEWLDPGFLDGLVATSVKVMIGEGEKKVQDLRIGG